LKFHRDEHCLPVSIHLASAVSKWIGIWYRTVPIQAQGKAAFLSNRQKWRAAQQLLHVAFNGFSSWRVITDHPEREENKWQKKSMSLLFFPKDFSQ